MFFRTALLLVLTPGVVFSAPCVVPDNGFGTADLPPTCADGYDGFLQISTGLPVGTTIDIDVQWKGFFNQVEAPGGLLGGHRQTFDGFVEMSMTGTGILAGFNRFIVMQVANVTDSAPRTPGQPMQSFAADVFTLDGEIFGDPDFDHLKLEAGTSFGLPSPGHTVLTEQGANFNVDSFFDVFYEITFVGAPGSVLDGFGGTTQRTDEFRAGEPALPGVPCFEPDNGFGTIDLPPLCPPGYDGHLTISTGLPAGATIEIDALLGGFFNRVEVPGGGLGGHQQNFDGTLQLPMTGTGPLAGFQRNMVMQVAGETWSAPRTFGDPVQDFDQELWNLTGTIFGDPDFDLLSIMAGSSTGSPSPGHTTLVQQPVGPVFEVESFFDICWEIRFVGAPGSILDGLSGTTTGCSFFYVGVLPTDAPDRRVAAGGPELRARPNPLPAGTTAVISFRAEGPVSLRVFDVTGRLVRTLLDDTPGDPGPARWDGRTDRGEPAAAGVYFYRLTSPAGSRTEKMTLLR